jgi:hypothetical protein
MYKNMTTITSVLIGAIIMILLTSNVSLYASNGSSDKDNPFFTSQGNRPAINPDFDPDFDCIYDVSQIHCIPGSAQDCPKPQFSAGDPQMCFPKTLVDGEWKWVCPEGYHNVDDDETGQCYSNEEECQDYEVFEEGKGGDDSDGCRALDYVCDDDVYREHEECIEYCDEDPDRQVCRPDM